MRTWAWALLACLQAGAGAAAELRSWSDLSATATVAPFADAAGTTVAARVVDGPAPGVGALRVETSLVSWGGVWFPVRKCPGVEGLHFQAKSETGPLLMDVILSDSEHQVVDHLVRLKGGAWESVELPLESFTQPDWRDPQADPKGRFHPGHWVGMSLAPHAPAKSAFRVGPLESARVRAAKDGLMSKGVIQDFLILEHTAFGSFVEGKGSALSMDVGPGAPGESGPAARVDYTLIPDGWCGVWIRSGEDWRGQDWSAAAGIGLEVYSVDPIQLQLAFNDANQNAYLSPPLETSAGAWTTLKASFHQFALNPNYQPERARKGAALDLSHVDSFNIAPFTSGKHRFWVRRARLIEKGP